MSLQYSRFDREDGTGNITLFYEGEMYIATSDHPNWAGIVKGLEDNDPEVVDLFDISRVVARKFESLSERVRVNNSRVYFDGDEVDTVLTRQIVRFLDEGRDFVPLVKFYERLATNPNQESVEQLYNWLNSHDFTITEDGKIIGYKGVQSDGKGGFESVNTGKAIVNGEQVSGHVPNNVGDVIEMPRADVTFDPNKTCSYGLHIGTWEYAQWWGRDGAILKVLVDPRDVVSVPSDAGGQKLRACRYTVLEILKQEIKDAVVSSYEDEEDHEYCECGSCLTCGEYCECDDFYQSDDDDDEGCSECEDTTVDENQLSVVDVSTTVNPTLAWPSYCITCNGPCTF
jgi:hypothetical protein